MTDEDRADREASLDGERFIEELQGDGAVHLPADVTLEQLRIFRVMALFRAASSDAQEPAPAFVEALRTRLSRLLETTA